MVRSSHPLEVILKLTKSVATNAFSQRHLYSTLLIPVRSRGVCSLVNRETLLGLWSEFRSDAPPATTIDFSEIRIHDSLCANRVL